MSRTEIPCIRRVADCAQMLRRMSNLKGATLIRLAKAVYTRMRTTARLLPADY